MPEAHLVFFCSLNWDWGYNDVRGLFGKSSSYAVSLGEIFSGDIHFNFNDKNKFVGAGVGVGVGGGFDLTYWITYTKGIVISIDEYNQLIAPWHTPVLFLVNKIRYGDESEHEVNLIDKGDYWISEDALKRLE